jgi:NADH-quinone oxidoreductase subunit J
MTLEIILFSLFALIAAVSSVLMITRRNPVISALFLILNFGALAGIYLLLNAQFIEFVHIIVYAGSFMVLFLFVIMLLRPDTEKNLFSDNPKMKILAVVIGVFVFFQIFYILLVGNPSQNIDQDIQRSIEVGTVEYIGRELYTKYVIPIQVAAFILLGATIGALIISKKKID